MTGPDIEQVDVSNAATPLSEDILAQLQGFLSQGLGTGVGPLQQGAGTAIQQFVTALQGSGGRSEGLDRLITGLEAGSERRTNTAAANQREAFGIAGSRFGTPLATGEALLRSEAATGLDQTIGSLLETGRQFDTNALLQGIAQMFGQGQANVSQFTGILPIGVQNPETIVSPSLGGQIVSGVLQGGSNLLLPGAGSAVGLSG
jgi:hypothetical protein